MSRKLDTPYQSCKIPFVPPQSNSRPLTGGPHPGIRHPIPLSQLSSSGPIPLARSQPCWRGSSLHQNRPIMIAFPLTSRSVGTRFSRNQISLYFTISSQSSLEKSSCRFSSLSDMIIVSVGCEPRKDRRSARTATKVVRWFRSPW